MIPFKHSTPFLLEDSSPLTILTGISAPVAIFFDALWKRLTYVSSFFKSDYICSWCLSISAKVASLCGDAIFNLILLFNCFWSSAKIRIENRELRATSFCIKNSTISASHWSSENFYVPVDCDFCY